MADQAVSPVDVVRGVIETSSQKHPAKLSKKIVAALRQTHGLDAVDLRALEIAVAAAKVTHPVDHRYMERALAKLGSAPHIPNDVEVEDG